MIVLVVALAGGLGSAARVWIDAATRRQAHATSGLSLWGTSIVNLSGSLVIGIVVGVGSGVLAPEWVPALSAGFLGGYTTFSTAAVQAAELLLAGQWRAAAVYAAGLLLGAAACAGAGLWIGRAIAG